MGRCIGLPLGAISYDNGHYLGCWWRAMVPDYHELRAALHVLGLEDEGVEEVVKLVHSKLGDQHRRNDPEIQAQDGQQKEQLRLLLKNEEEFVANLNVVTKTYLFPIQSGAIKMKTQTQLAIFGSIELLAGLHSDFLKSVRAAQTAFPRVAIGTLFEEFVPSLAVYTQYVNKFSASLAALEGERLRSKNFAQFLLSCEESDTMPLEALLSFPLNRVPHYRGVLTGILANTPRNGDEYMRLAKVTQELGDLQEYLNQNKSQSDQMGAVYKIESRIVGREYALNDLHRAFVREGDAVVVGHGEDEKKQKESHLFLFNDILLITKKIPQKNQFRWKQGYSIQYNTLTVPSGDLLLHLSNMNNSKESLSLSFGSQSLKQEWATSIQKCLEAMEATKVFQTTLQQVMEREPKGTVLPSIMMQLIITLEKTALQVPGLFRISGSSRVITSIISQLDRGITVDFSKLDCHVVSGLLKQWLRTLKEPLIPFAYFDRFLECQSAPDSTIALQLLMQELPETNMLIIRRIIQMCLKVSEHSEVNKMTSTNMAIVIGPNICREENPSPFGEISISSTVGPLVDRMQQQFDDIFPKGPAPKFAKVTPKIGVATSSSGGQMGALMGARRNVPPSADSNLKRAIDTDTQLIAEKDLPLSPPPPEPAESPEESETSATPDIDFVVHVEDHAPAPLQPPPPVPVTEEVPIIQPRAVPHPPLKRRGGPPPRGGGPPPRPTRSNTAGSGSNPYPLPVPSPAAPPTVPAPPIGGRAPIPASTGAERAVSPPGPHPASPVPVGLSGIKSPVPVPASSIPAIPIPATPPLQGEGRGMGTSGLPPVPPIPVGVAGRAKGPMHGPAGGPPRGMGRAKPLPPRPPPTLPGHSAPPKPVGAPPGPLPAIPTGLVPPQRAPSPPPSDPEPPEERAPCSRCNEAVGAEFVELGEHLWHPQCFLCVQCSSELSAGYFRFEGKPMCRSCHRQTRRYAESRV